MKKINRWIVLSLCGAIVLSVSIGFIVGCQNSKKASTVSTASKVILNSGNSKTQSNVSTSSSNSNIKVSTTPTIKANTVKTVASYKEIIALLKSNSTKKNTTYNTFGGVEKSTNATAAATDPQAVATSQNSTTNIQVAGVDEADIIKHDGNTIYFVSQGKIIIADISDPTKMKILSTITCLSGKGSPIEAYLVNSKLIVISNYYEPQAQTSSQPAMGKPNIMIAPAKGVMSAIMPWYGGDTAAIIYDISNKTAPKELRSFIQQGSYLSSRLVDNYLYLATNRNAYYYENMKDTDLIPSTTDSANKNGAVPVPPGRITISDYKQYSAFFVVSGLDVNDTSKAADTQALLGWGNNIYATQNSLYVAIPRQEQITPSTSVAPQAQTTSNNTGSGTAIGGTTTTTAPAIKSGAMLSPIYYSENTDVIKFMLNKGKISLIATGSVNGTVLNQFSMDEDAGYFRIATTTGQFGGSDSKKNNLYILDGQMKPVSKLEGLAKGEQIYSVRFMGDRAFLVTFRTVDPLFAFDLKDPKNPKMLGELKTPGFSKYLHPWGSKYILGIGLDADITSGRATGMKIALFDVSDLSNPKQFSVYKIGDSGTTSDVLNNQKALLVMEQAGYIGFPVSIRQISDAQKNDPFAYGQFKFSGFYLLNIDPSKGANAISYRGSVTHLASQDEQLAYQPDNQILRGIIANDKLYTVSNGLIKANSTDGSKYFGELKLPVPVYDTTGGVVTGKPSSGSTGTTTPQTNITPTVSIKPSIGAPTIK